MSLRFEEIAAHYLAWAEVHRAPGTVGYYRRYIEQFARLHGRKRITALKSHHLLAFGRTWHRVQTIQRVMRWAHEEAELCDVNPFAKVKKPRAGRRRRVLSRHETLAAMRCARREFRAVMLFLRETIARPQEARAARWEYLRRADHSIDLLTSLKLGLVFLQFDEFKGLYLRKADEGPRIIPLNRRVGRLLARLASRLTELRGPIFLNARGRPWTNNATRLQMKAVRLRAGLTRDARGESVVLYTLRHTTATSAAVIGVRDKVLAELLGHTTTRCTQRYCHLNLDHLSHAMAEITAGRRARKLV